MDELEKRTKNLRSVHDLMRRKARTADPISVDAFELVRVFIMIKDAGARREVIDLAKKLSSS